MANDEPRQSPARVLGLYVLSFVGLTAIGVGGAHGRTRATGLSWGTSILIGLAVGVVGVAFVAWRTHRRTGRFGG